MGVVFGWRSIEASTSSSTPEREGVTDGGYLQPTEIWHIWKHPDGSIRSTMKFDGSSGRLLEKS